MKQLIIRVIPGITGVFDCIFGNLEDGQFTPCSFDQLDSDFSDYIRVDDLLGTTAYIRAPDLTPVVLTALDLDAQLSLYQSFIVISFPDYESQKEKES